jgi:hypothetical protein
MYLKINLKVGLAKGEISQALKILIKLCSFLFYFL